jgi:hypothetical protein
MGCRRERSKEVSGASSECGAVFLTACMSPQKPPVKHASPVAQEALEDRDVRRSGLTAAQTRSRDQSRRSVARMA